MPTHIETVFARVTPPGTSALHWGILQTDILETHKRKGLNALLAEYTDIGVVYEFRELNGHVGFTQVYGPNMGEHYDNQLAIIHAELSDQLTLN